MSSRILLLALFFTSIDLTLAQSDTPGSLPR